MIQKYTYKDLVWVDLESPTKEEVESTIRQYELHPVIGEEFLQKTVKSRVDFYKNGVFLALHFPLRHRKDGRVVVADKEVDFVIGKNFIVTARNEAVEPLQNFSKIFEVNSIIDKAGIGEHAGFIFYFMLKKMYHHIEHDLDTIKDELIAAESRIFSGEERTMVEVLSNLSRELIDIKHVTRTHKDVLHSFSQIDKDFFGEEFNYYIEDIKSEYQKIFDSIIGYRELLDELRETNDSLLSTKQSETVKLFTIMAFVTFPLSLIASIFSLRTTHVPIVGSPHDFEIIMGIMIIAIIAMYGVFKYRKWL